MSPLPMSLRADHLVIASMVERGAKVLDVGCGDGELLDMLQRERGAVGRGMELSQEGVNACVARGLSVVRGDADRDLSDYPDAAFDVVILSKTIQAVRRPPVVLSELLRIGRCAVESFPNMGHWRQRARLALTGRMPVAPHAHGGWSDSDTLHLCTIRDFMVLIETLGLSVDKAVPISEGEARAPFAKSAWAANWLAEEAVFLLRRA